MTRASKETLKNGKVLNELIQMFIKEPKGESLYPVLLCLIDSDLQVPMNLVLSDEDMAKLQDVKIGEELSFDNDLRMRPDWLQSPETKKLYFPIFSTIEEAGKDYSENFSWINMDIDTCINFADDNKECSGLILNAFTTPIIIEGAILDTLKEILERERHEEPIELDKDNIKDIDFDEVIAITVAEGGAMGEPNGLLVVDENMKLYHSNFAFGNFKSDELKEKFPIIGGFDCPPDKINELDLDWKWFNLGAGNALLIRDKYYEYFKDRVESELGKDYKKGELYQRWYELLKKVVIIKK